MDSCTWYQSNPGPGGRHPVAYRGGVRGLIVYTGLRVALFLAAWLIVQLVTPWRGLLAIAVAIVVSGVVGFFLLDRSRDSASASVWGVFRRINERIERNALEEDALVEAAAADRGRDAEGGTGVEVLSTEGEPDSEQQAVGGGEQAGHGQDRDEITAGGAIENAEPGPHGERE